MRDTRTCGSLIGLGLFALTLAVPAEASAQVIRSGPATCRAVAVTFDLCPVRAGLGYDEALIQTLIEKRLPATFFVSGRWAARHEDQLRRLTAIPFFEFGTHGDVHAHLPLLPEDRQRAEIQDAVDLLRTQFGLVTTLFRPPYGEFDDMTVRLVRALGLRFILWNVVSGDPDPALTKEAMLAQLAPRTRNGAILVFHANGKGRHTKAVVEALYERVLVPKGLQPLTVTSLLDRCDLGVTHASPILH